MNKLEWTEAPPRDVGWVAKTPEGIHLRLTIEPDDTPVEGNAMCSDDDAADAEYEQAINYLGSCSYNGFDDFASEDGHLPQMVSEAIDDLIRDAKIALSDSLALLSKHQEQTGLS